MPSTKVSVAEARRNFAPLIERAEHGRVIEITRRGKAVAVLLSAAEYAVITKRSSFIEAARQVRDRMGVEDLGIGVADFDGLRDRLPGR